MYQGDYTPAKTVVFNFNTASFSDGSPITLAGTPALSVYKNSTTESTAGVTLTVDYDSRTGMHHVAIDTSADGTFYAAGNDFDVIITTGTVGGTSVVGRKVGSFSLSNRSALRPATADRTLVVDAAGLADANAVKIGPTGSGTAQTARDLGASVLLSAGTGAGQLDFTSGVVKANATQWLGGTIPAVNVTGVPLVDAKYLLGTIFVTPATAGIMDVNAKNWANVAVTGMPMPTYTQPTGFLAEDFSELDADVEAIQTGVAAIPTTPLLAANVPANFAALGITAGGHISNVDTLATYTGNTVQTGDAYARLGAPAGASVSADIAAVNAKTTNLPASPAAVGSAMTLTSAYDFAKGTVAMTESYPALHAAPTPIQALFVIEQVLIERAIAGTTLTVKKVDGATQALTATLDSATAPTSQTRAS